MSEDAVVKRRGRPALHPSEKKRRNVTFRLRDSFREEIERRAIQNGRSMSEEIETILEKFVPLADVITKEFTDDIKNLLDQYKIEVHNRKVMGEMTRWNATVFRKIAGDLKDQSDALQQRSELYASIEKMMIAVNINETDRLAIMAGLENDLNKSAELLNKSARIPEIPTAEIKEFKELE